jgi:hypothetical protein
VNDLPAAGAERNDGIETVAELRREQPVDRLDIVAFALGRPKPMAALAMSAAPALVVMIRMTLRKSTCLPLWSVSLP